jgi:hypothetical protein
MKLWLVRARHYESGEMYSEHDFCYLVAAVTKESAIELLSGEIDDRRDEGAEPITAEPFVMPKRECVITG